MPVTPAIVTGTIKSTTKRVSNVIVSIRNESTGEVLTATTNNDGDYVFDAANYSQGYTLGDVVKSFIDEGYPFMDDNIFIDSGVIELK